MPLSISLKPHERVIIGGAVLKNSSASTACHLTVENKVPVLRQSDILSESEADSPSKRLYFCVQLLYVQGLTEELNQLYWDLVKDLLDAAPSTKLLLSDVSQYIVESNYYQALKAAKRLIHYEEELLKNESKST